MSALARVVILAEDEHYVAYYAAMDTIQGAAKLGSIHIGAVHRHQHRYRDWVDLMRHLAHELTIDVLGEGVRWADILIEDCIDHAWHGGH